MLRQSILIPYFIENCARISETRDKTASALIELGFTVIPSQANFVFASSDRISGKELYLKLKDMGILIRHFETDRIREFNRITIGSAEEMKIFIEAIQKILSEVKG